jgi:hypothetical protein
MDKPFSHKKSETIKHVIYIFTEKYCLTGTEVKGVIKKRQAQ